MSSGHPRQGSKPLTLSIRNFAHLADVSLQLGDLTVLVGPQGAGKSLALQWLKVAMDCRQIVDALRAAGHLNGRADVLMDLVFGTGMGSAWRDDETEVALGARKITPKTLGRVGDGTETLFRMTCRFGGQCCTMCRFVRAGFPFPPAASYAPMSATTFPS